MKVYPDFKSVPDGVKCRPRDTSNGITFWMKKELWLDGHVVLHSSKSLLGEWETDEPEPIKYPEKGRLCLLKQNLSKIAFGFSGCDGGFSFWNHYASHHHDFDSFTEVSHVVLKDGTIMCGCGGTEIKTIGYDHNRYVKKNECQSCGQVIEE